MLDSNFSIRSKRLAPSADQQSGIRLAVEIESATSTVDGISLFFLILSLSSLSFLSRSSP
jgi:hypothetical protein